jgi:hypothetical protein
VFDTVTVRTAYRCRAYPDTDQQQTAHYTRRAFTMPGGELRLAKTVGPQRFTWSWPEVDVAALDPTMVVVSREPDGRWYVTFAIETGAPGAAGQAVTACGAGVRHPGISRVRPAVKQEPRPVTAGIRVLQGGE